MEHYFDKLPDTSHFVRVCGLKFGASTDVASCMNVWIEIAPRWIDGSALHITFWVDVRIEISAYASIFVLCRCMD